MLFSFKQLKSINAKQRIKKLLRKKVFWLLTLPLTVLVLNSIIYKVKSLEDFHVTFLNFIVGGPVFPAFSLVGIGFDLNKLPRVLPFVISIIAYTLFGLFLKNLHRLKNKTLFVLSFLIFLIIIFGLRGCSMKLASPLVL